MGMTKKELSRTCREAARVIEIDGLCKDGTYGQNDGPKCAIGAMRFARWGNVETFLDLDDVVGTNLNDLFRKARPLSKRKSLSDFNDAPRTRKHDVVGLLRDMAVAAVEA